MLFLKLKMFKQCWSSRAVAGASGANAGAAVAAGAAGTKAGAAGA